MKNIVKLLSLALSFSMLACGCSTEQEQISDVSDVSTVSESEQSSVEESSEESSSVTSEESSLAEESDEQESLPETSRVESEDEQPAVDSPLFSETRESIELTDEQKDILTQVYDKYTKMAYVFFNQAFDYKDEPKLFEGTEYEFHTEFLTEDEMPDEFKELHTEDWSIPNSFVKYTGSAVNTVEKFEQERSEYFTDSFINKATISRVSSILSSVIWEDGEGVYKYCGYISSKPMADYYDLYVKEFTESDGRIEIKLLCDRTVLYDEQEYERYWGVSMEEQPGYAYQYYYITLVTDDDGDLKMDNFCQESVRDVYELDVTDFYESGILHF
ncbi:MAG: hypothetical protein J1E39_08490 [Eubacterium sp.]|nr:hypothetical protein [Eubacterium sp.]